MKRVTSFIIGVLLVLSIFSGCDGLIDDGIDNITIYTLERDTFLQFLQENEKQYLIQNCTYYIDCETIDHFVTADGYMFYITDVFCNYMQSARALEKFLKEYEIDESVVDVAVVDVAGFPFAAWVKTEENAYFITINEAYSERLSNSYVYRLYTPSEYVEELDQGEALLMVKGESVPAFRNVELHEDHAEIPLEAVLVSLGATSRIIDNDTRLREITFLNEVYILNNDNITFLDEENTDLLLLENEGPNCIYNRRGIVYVGSVALVSILDEMGMQIEVTYDPITNVLDISPRTS